MNIARQLHNSATHRQDGPDPNCPVCNPGILKGAPVNEVHERPDLPHDSDCARRLHGAAECTCGKDDRPEETADTTPAPLEVQAFWAHKQERRTIDLTPVGCQTPEGSARVQKAMETLDNRTRIVADMATTMVERLANSEQWTAEEHEALKNAVANRYAAQESFLRAVAGAPPAPSAPLLPCGHPGAQITNERGTSNFPYCQTCNRWYLGDVDPDPNKFREIERETIEGRELLLMEDKEDDDDAPKIIVDAVTGHIVMDEVYAGFDDYRDEQARVRQTGRG